MLKRQEGLMSRTIKFRAWDKESKYMQYFNSHKTGILYYQEEFEVSSGWDSMDRPTFNKTTKNQHILMQYTGLKDKNGKEIYEGDIVRCFSTKRCPHTVIWDGFGWDLEGLYAGYRWGGEEVIGNIYESPELLEEK